MVNIDLVEGSSVLDQMNTGKIDNTDKDSYLILFEDESLGVSLDNQSISVENDSHLNSEDSLSISGTGICLLCSNISLMYLNFSM